MRCPYCHHSDSKVIDSRDTPDNDGIRRRRECLKCSLRFTTYERVQPVSITIVKKDGRREEYNRQKLLEKIRIACSKRPIPTEVINHAVDEIEVELFRAGESEIPSRAIGELVLNKLRGIDHVAYIRFASVYRDFRDIDSLRAELEQLQGAKASANGSGPTDEVRRNAPRRTAAKRGRR
jgi:transcriptional repressor NrdR